MRFVYLFLICVIAVSSAILLLNAGAAYAEEPQGKLDLGSIDGAAKSVSDALKSAFAVHKDVKPKDQMAMSPDTYQAMQASDAAYAANAPEKLGSAKLVKQIDSPQGDPTEYHTKVYVDESRKTVTVAFRGTDSKNDVMTDAKANLVDCTYKNFRTGQTETAGKCHEGFRDVYNAQADQIYEATKDLVKQGYKVNFAGHSLGGAEATIAATALTQSYGASSTTVNLITFGAPRVGDQKFVDTAYSSIFQTMSYVTASAFDKNGGTLLDPVTQIPPKKWGFVDTKSSVKYFVPCPTEDCASVNRHRMSNYVQFSKASMDQKNINFLVMQTAQAVITPKDAFKNLVKRGDEWKVVVKQLSGLAATKFLSAVSPKFKKLSESKAGRVLKSFGVKARSGFSSLRKELADLESKIANAEVTMGIRKKVAAAKRGFVSLKNKAANKLRQIRTKSRQFKDRIARSKVGKFVGKEVRAAKNSLRRAGQKIRSFASKAKNKARDFYLRTKEKSKAAFTRAKAALRRAKTKLANSKFGKLYTRAKTALKKRVASAKSKVKNMYRRVKTRLANNKAGKLYSRAKTAVKRRFASIKAKGKSALVRAKSTLKKIVAGAKRRLASVKAKAKSVFVRAKSKAKHVFVRAKAKAKSMLARAKSNGKTAFIRAKAKSKAIVSRARQGFSRAKSAAKAKLNKTVSRAKATFSHAKAKAKASVSRAVSKVKSFAKRLFGRKK